MKKQLLLLISFLAIVASTSAQSWLMQNSGFSDTADYPAAIKIINSNTVWLFSNSPTGAPAQETSITLNGGTNWTVHPVTSNSNWGIITGTASSADSAWALLFDFNIGGGMIFATIDGGFTWAEQDSGIAFTGGSSFPDFIHFWNSQEGIAVGDPDGGYYEIYRTLNGGLNWTRVDSANIPLPLAGEAGNVNDFSVAGDNIWFGAYLNRVYHSSNRGINWTVSTINSDSSVAGPMAFKDASHGLTTITLIPSHAIGGLYSSSDSGATWTQVNYTGTAGNTDIVSVPGSTAYVSCESAGPSSGYSSYSVDNGQTWILIDTTGNGTTNGYSKLDFTDPYTGWAGGFTQSPVLDGVYRWNENVLNVKEMSNDKTVNIYPNPMTNELNVKLNNIEQAEIFIYDIASRKLLQQIFTNSTTINTKELSNGFYIYEVKNKNGEIKKGKLVKE